MCRLYGFFQPEPSGLSFLLAIVDDACSTDWEVGSVESLIGRHQWSWCDDGAAYHDLFRYDSFDPFGTAAPTVSNYFGGK